MKHINELSKNINKTNKSNISEEETEYLKRKQAHEKREEMFHFSKFEAIKDVWKNIVWLLKNAFFSFANDWKFNYIGCLIYMFEICLIPFIITIIASLYIPDFTVMHYCILGIFLGFLSQILQYIFVAYRILVIFLGTCFYSMIITSFSNTIISKIYEWITMPTIISSGGNSGVFQNGLDVEINVIGLIFFLIIWILLFCIQYKIRKYHPVYQYSDGFKQDVIDSVYNLKLAFSSSQREGNYER